MAQNSLKQMTKTREAKLGHFIVEFATPGMGHILKAAGCDFVFFDMEHSGFSFETLKSAIRYCEAAGVPTIVRVPAQENCSGLSPFLNVTVRTSRTRVRSSPL